MYLYAIREKSTKFWLGGDAHYSNTWCEPSSGSRPRLFFTKRGAQNSLTAWLRGRMSIERSKQDDILAWRNSLLFTVEPIPSRKRENMEIVIFELKEL